MYIFLIVVYAVLSLGLIGLILLQRGRGSQTGLTYDPQASVFGSSGSVSFLVKLTTAGAVLFFVLGIVIGINFRDSVTMAPESLIERTLSPEDLEVLDEDQSSDTPDDVPTVAEIEDDAEGDVPEPNIDDPSNAPSNAPLNEETINAPSPAN